MTNWAKFTGFKDLTMNFKKIVIEKKKAWFPNGIECVDKETFLKDNKDANMSIFTKLDMDNDGYISKQEYEHVTQYIDKDHDGVVSEEENQKNTDACMKEMKLFARRGIDKWFKIDRDRSGYMDNFEREAWTEYNMNNSYMGGHLSHEELKEYYSHREGITEQFNCAELTTDWLDADIDSLINIAQGMYGVELNQEQIEELRAEQKKQLNTWLFKTGDNDKAPLYCQCNVDAYTRLVTSKEAVSCCGGDITPPPVSPQKDSCVPVFRSMEESLDNQKKKEKLEKQLESGEISKEKFEKEWKSLEIKNTSEEVKNRLAWAAFKTPPKEMLLQKEGYTVWEGMSDEQYNYYHSKWNELRNMKASDFRDLLKPENADKRAKFELTHNMTVEQIVQYIDIVESEIGVDFDSENWSIGQEKFIVIAEKVNGTYGDEERLDGKTRADIPENRQALLKYLDNNNLLNDQFKKDNNVEEHFEQNNNNGLVHNSETNTASRRVLSNDEINQIRNAKIDELLSQYDPSQYDLTIDVNEYGDIHWAVRVHTN